MCFEKRLFVCVKEREREGESVHARKNSESLMQTFVCVCTQGSEEIKVFAKLEEMFTILFLIELSLNMIANWCTERGGAGGVGMDRDKEGRGG